MVKVSGLMGRETGGLKKILNLRDLYRYIILATYARARVATA
jgi:hypothetical protein